MWGAKVCKGALTHQDTSYPEDIWYPNAKYPREFYTGIP